MFQIVSQSLQRQAKALSLLFELLEEEYFSIMERKTETVVALEFSLQELIRQIAVEKSCVIRSLAGQRVLAYAESLPEEQADELRNIFAEVDRGEQRAARQASRNAQLSLALLDQSTRNLRHLTKQVTPPDAEIYGSQGSMCYKAHPDAVIISGRL